MGNDFGSGTLVRIDREKQLKKWVIILAYKLLIVSSIPAYNIDGQFHSLDLWVKDLEKQIDYVSELSLVCPLVESSRIKPAMNLLSLPRSVNVVPKHTVMKYSDIEELAQGHDVIQIAANLPIWKARIEKQFLKVAREKNKIFITALSSNRAKTIMLNAQGKGPIKYLKSLISYMGLNFAIAYFTAKADGCLLVGEGLRELVSHKQKNIHIGTASWIRTEDFLPDAQIEHKANQLTDSQRLKLCVATRLEPMKGVHIALDALSQLQEQLGNKAPELLILGEGEELENLQKQSRELNLDQLVTFGGVRSYPEQFFEAIGQYNLMLLTNLNDEQPRLIFDAISQGLVPICPDSLPFRTLDLAKEVYFEKGDAKSLAQIISNVMEIKDPRNLLTQLTNQAKSFTIDKMHEKRARWIEGTLKEHSE